MRVSRIFTDNPLAAGAQVEFDARTTRYVTQVLRLREGQRVTLFNGTGSDWAAELRACRRTHCVAQVIEPLNTEPPPSRPLHLGIGISRGERMDFAIQKSVELGVTAITPLVTEHGVVQLDASREQKRLAHWHGVIVAACEQSGRCRLADLNPVTPITSWLNDCRGGLLLYHRANTNLAQLEPAPDSLNLLIGPEGGLSQQERELAVAREFIPVRLGPRVLRTETAPIAALAIVQARWGDFRDAD